ncbi:glycosyltransferase [Paenibacillus sp. HB172176]|uniref:glycosyltransferase n=1 Tax=Paenibacillus sp. HB172176 TaxID=2493690 RepID=UPI001439F7BB|nr:glycosyltransferase [Paenibacillus sp. HB172176]
MKICMLIRKHSFLDVRVFQRQAKSLAALGHQVVVMAPRYNGQLLNINKKPVQAAGFGGSAFELDGVSFASYPARQPNAYQIANVQKTMLRVTQQRQPLYGFDGLLRRALFTDADVYHVHEPDLLFEAVQLKRLFQQLGKRVSIVYDAHELEVDAPLMRELMLEADHLITVSDSIAAIYEKRHPSIPISIIYNSPKGADRRSHAERDASRNPQRFTIAYEGMLTLDKGDPRRIQSIVNALTEAGVEVRFKIFGQLKMPASMAQKRMENWLRRDGRVSCQWVDYEQLHNQWREVDIGYIYYDLRAPNRKFALPNKFFSMMNNGIPIIVNGAREMSDIVLSRECGIVLEEGKDSAAQYAEQLLQLSGNRPLLEQMGANAVRAMNEKYGWERMEAKLKEIYAKL